MQRAAIREAIDRTSVTFRYSLPESLPKIWRTLLFGTDLLAVLASCYVAGLPAAVGPAACVIVCGAMALCGAYRISYAVLARDEVYHALVACAIAAIPFWALLHLVTGLATPSLTVAILLIAVTTSALRAAFHVVRRRTIGTPIATSDFVSPEGQWRIGRPLFATGKRAFDVALASMGLIAVSPVMIAAACAIAIESGWPVLFRQERVGRRGSRFTMLKFRTMRQDAGAQWAQPGDSRITRVGALLRRASIDELPQLVNVIRGEMALVGPRPEMPEFAHQFRHRIAHYDDRSMVRPGLTGWAQLHYKRNLSPEDAPTVLGYDLFYVEQGSLILDTVIVAKTAAEFLFHHAV